MLAYISDANILIDVEVGGLLAPMFSLGYPFAVPDVLFFEGMAVRNMGGSKPQNISQPLYASTPCST